MKTLKTILQSKKIIIIVTIITILLTIIRIGIPKDIQDLTTSKEISGIVCEKKIENEKLTLTIKAEEKIRGTYYFHDKKDKKEKKKIQIGDNIKVRGEITKPSSPTTNNLFDYKKYLEKKKIYYVMEIDNITIQKKTTSLYHKIKNTLLENLSNSYQQAFLLGQDDNIEEDVKTSYQKNGISHLFAISGMQFYLLANMIIAILKKLKIKDKTAYKITILFLFSYLSLIGLTPSIIRGILFFILFSINRVWKLKIDQKILIFWSIIITIHINPYFLTEAAFWYSYIISIGLIYFLKDNTSYWKMLWISSCLSFFLSIPISLYYFYEINILSIIYNLFYIPYVNYMVFPMTILTTIFSILEPIYAIVINILENTSQMLSQIKWGTLIFPKVNILIYIIELFLIVISCKYKKKFIFILILCILLGHYFSFYGKKDMIKVIDVGQGDSILLFSKGKTALIDTGGSIRFDGKTSESITKYTTIPLLKSLGIKKLDKVILTHGDEDHMGEIFYLNSHFPIKDIYINLGNYTELEEKLLMVRDDTQQSVQDLTLKVGSFTLYQLNKSWNDENESSSIYYVYHPKLTTLLLGDATQETEKYILNTYQFQTDILKVAHHGSNTSTSKELLETIKPKLAIISVGKENTYGHPNQEVLDRLIEHNIPYLTTSNSGTISIHPTTQQVQEEAKER